MAVGRKLARLLSIIYCQMLAAQLPVPRLEERVLCQEAMPENI